MAVFRPMLAVQIENLESLRLPVFASGKLDGIRAVVIDGVLMSRSMKPIPNPTAQRLFGRPEYNGFDGELIVGNPTDPNCYQNTMSVMRKEEELENLHFYVFDDCGNPDLTFNERLDSINERVSGSDGPIKIVKQHFITSLTTLQTLEESHLSAGFEGLMLRDPNGKYKQGRSTLKQGWLLKLKRFQDSEAEIIGFEPKRRNIAEREISETGYSKTTCRKDDFETLDLLGSLIVRDVKTSVEFSIGSGFNDLQREQFWRDRQNLLGMLVKYQHFSNQGVKEKPRFPTFLGFRSELDL